MPPTATTTMRKTATTTTGLSSNNEPATTQRRTTSGRAVRANTTRPTNYYVKPYASFAAAGAAANDAEMADAPPPGFFPALTYFTDAITALPKEVMRQFTLMKEVEAKIHGPNEELGEVVDSVMQYPVPRRKEPGIEGGAEMAIGPQGLLSLTANNSMAGSTAASLINGVAPNANLASASAQNSVSGSVNGEDTTMAGGDEEMVKRQQFHELRMLTSKLLINLDEKNVVLAEANRILAQQHARLDSVIPHIDNEISEEARLGSMTHWAYADNRQKKQVTGTAANRRDVAATLNLAAAASAMHESDIAAARRDATRENAREKHKGKSKEQVDSDFDDKPKKTHAKIAKSKAAGPAGAAGLGITANGELVKKRKVDKGLAAPGLDRSASSKGAKAAKDTPRSTPNAEPSKKVKAKPAPLPAKKKSLAGASPALASSPLHSSFNAAAVESNRPQSARLRQNSTATNLRHEKLASDDRPTSAPTKANGEKSSKRKVPEDEQSEAAPTVERHNSLKREETDISNRPHASRSQSNSGKAGRGSGTGTPRQESFADDVPGMKRTRSTRSMRGNRDESSSEPQASGRPSKHKRVNSHLVRQLAPFNRSPDLDRDKDDVDEDLDSLDGAREKPVEREGESAQRSPPKRRPTSRRNTGALVEPSPPASEHANDDAEMPDASQDMASENDPEPETTTPPAPTAQEEDPDTTIEVSPHAAHEAGTAPSPSPIPSAPPDLASDIASDAEEEAYDSDELGDPDDPNEPKYCYCDRGSYGEMIACDNEQCPREWFHLGCTGLKEPPEEEEKWFCRDCAPLFSHQSWRGRGGRGGRGKG